MKLSHYGIDITVPDDWWVEAGMVGFVPLSKSYRFRQDSGILIQEICILDVGPVLRNPIFRDGSENEGSARERVVRILRDFRLAHFTHPVNVVDEKLDYPYRYKLTHGVHRFYCSLAVGYTHVPAVKGFFNINAPDN